MPPTQACPKPAWGQRGYSKSTWRFPRVPNIAFRQKNGSKSKMVSLTCSPAPARGPQIYTHIHTLLITGIAEISTSRWGYDLRGKRCWSYIYLFTDGFGSKWWYQWPTEMIILSHSQICIPAGTGDGWSGLTRYWRTWPIKMGMGGGS